MVVQKENVRSVYIGNGSTTVFPITFEVNEAHPEWVHLFILQDDNTYAETDNFIADMTAKTVTYPQSGTPLADGKRLVIMRELPLQQQLDLINQGDYYADDVEQALDDLTMITQQLGDETNRSLKLPIGSGDDIDTSLPEAVPGMAFGWSSDGKRIVNIDNPQAVYEQTVLLRDQTQTIKNETAQIRDETNDIKSDTEDIKDEAQGILNNVNATAAEVEQDRQEVANNAYEANLAADRAEAMAAQVEVYDSATTYEPGDVVMTAEGDTYRCIAESTGENPNSSNKWVLITQVKYETFELDVNGDLQPLYVPKTSTNFQIDENGDIMPIED